MDDVGFLPENIRQKILQEEGEFEIVVENLKKQKQNVIKSLRQSLEISTTELYQKLKAISGKSGVIHKGTKVEMDWLASYLQSNGVESIIIQAK